VETQQVGPIDQAVIVNNVGPSSIATELPCSFGTSTAPEASMDDICTSLPYYQQLLEELKIKKGPFQGEYKCWHCKINKKNMVHPADRQGWEFACGCSPLKAVVELALVKMEILGEDVGNDDIQDRQLKRSLSLTDWLKMSYVMEEMIGFKANWILDAAARKAGLQAAADNLEIL